MTTNNRVTIDQLVEALRAGAIELCTIYGWTSVSVFRRPPNSQFFEEEIEITAQPPYGESLSRIVRVGSEILYLQGTAVISAMAQNHLRELERDMAQWNQRQADRLREQEAQRRRAQGREDHPVAIEGGMAILNENLGYTSSRGNLNIQFQQVAAGTSADWSTTQPVTTANPYVQISPNNVWQTSSVVNIPSAGSNVETYGVTPDTVKSLIAEALKNLDICISIDHSDGEIEVEVEVSYNGEFITSDSDHVSI